MFGLKIMSRKHRTDFMMPQTEPKEKNTSKPGWNFVKYIYLKKCVKKLKNVENASQVIDFRRVYFFWLRK